ncbi:MAG: hypothetical protein KKD18_06955 [Nanoarchaeota archaeon]|nr:hypothetical protein [Nanoarchaeota archaeon]
MKRETNKIAVFVVISLVVALSVFIFFSVYFSWGFLVGTGKVIDEPNLEQNAVTVPTGQEDLNFVDLDGYQADGFEEQNISFGFNEGGFGGGSVRGGGSGGGSSGSGSGGGSGGGQGGGISLQSSYSIVTELNN